MHVRPIRNDEDHARAMKQIEALWGAPDGTREAELLEVLVTLINVYEAQHHAIEAPDPIDAVRFRMDQEGFAEGDP